MKGKTFLFCFGTRPEAIKMAPIIQEAKKRGHQARICITGQHREMLAPFLKFFQLEPDFDLDIMSPNQSLAAMTSKILLGMDAVLQKLKPDCLVVQGDTTTTFASTVSAFYHKIPVAYVEAGLRTGDLYSPFPEEANRKLVTQLAHYYFCPTEASQENLHRESVTKNVFVTGNTSIDSLRIAAESFRESKFDDEFRSKYKAIDFGKKLILVTVHRRENHGAPLESICRAIAKIAEREDVQIVLPVHLNPNVQSVVKSHLGSLSRVHLLEPLDYFDFTWLMSKSYLILTDSGGVQEEGPYFKKPVLVLRENTERPEGVTAGVSKLVGHKTETIVKEVSQTLDDSKVYKSFGQNVNPYGDGFASRKILDLMEQS